MLHNLCMDHHIYYSSSPFSNNYIEKQEGKLINEIICLYSNKKFQKNIVSPMNCEHIITFYLNNKSL